MIPVSLRQMNIEKIDSDITDEYSRQLTKLYPIDSIFGKHRERLGSLDNILDFLKGDFNRYSLLMPIGQVIHASLERNQWVGRVHDTMIGINSDYAVERDLLYRLENRQVLDIRVPYLMPTENLVRRCTIFASANDIR